MKTMGVNITTISYPRALIIEIASTIILMVVEAPGFIPTAIPQKHVPSFPAAMSMVLSKWIITLV